MKWWEKFKELIKKGIDFISDIVVEAAAFSIAAIKTTFSKTDKHIPKTDELNKEYIEKIDKVISTQEMEENKILLTKDEEKILSDEIDDILSNLEDMQIKGKDPAYMNALKKVFDNCDIKINEDNNYEISFPQKEHIDSRKKEKGDLSIKKSLIIDKNGNFISGERNYYNIHTHFRKTFFLNEADFNSIQLAVFKNACEKIENMKLQYEQTYTAKLYADDINRVYEENSLTKESVINALKEMNVSIDNNGNILNINDCNKFSINATDNLLNAIRDIYKIEEENILDNLQCKYEAMEITKDIIYTIKNIDECFKYNNLEPDDIEKMFSDYIGNESISSLSPSSFKYDQELDPKTKKIVSSIVVNAAEKICEKYEIDTDKPFIDAFKKRFVEKEVEIKENAVEEENAIDNIKKEEIDIEQRQENEHLNDLEENDDLEEP